MQLPALLQEALELRGVDVVMAKLVTATGEPPAEYAVADLMVAKT